MHVYIGIELTSVADAFKTLRTQGIMHDTEETAVTSIV